MRSFTNGVLHQLRYVGALALRLVHCSGGQEVSRFRLSQNLDMCQHPLVDAMDHKVRREHPVGLPIHVELVPGAALQRRAAVWRRHDAEFVAVAARCAIQVKRVHVPVGRQFENLGRLVRHVERQALRPVPCRNRLHEHTGRENTIPNSSNALAVNCRANRTGNAEAMVGFVRLW